MNCAELEILLCDYLDGALVGERKRQVESHLAACPGCAELFADASAAVGLMDRAALVEPPPELLTRILHNTPPMRQPWWSRLMFRGAGGGIFEPLLQPRYAMGMAMTVLSFSMIARFAGIDVRQLKPADLDPAKVYRTVDNRVHRNWDRAMKYYDNLRWVLELQARFKEWTEQEQELQRNQPSANPPAANVEDKSAAGQGTGATEQGKKP